jgi:hypothetical protein
MRELVDCGAHAVLPVASSVRSHPCDGLPVKHSIDGKFHSHILYGRG